MVRRALAAALALSSAFVLCAVVLAASAGSAFARGDGPDIKPLDPSASIKPEDGYFDEVFGIDDAGKRVAVIRTDGATFAKVETYDLEAKPPKLLGAFD